jgi:hypothetical protein
VNNGKPVQFNLEIAARSDFADLFEVKSGHIVRRGRIISDWSQRAAVCARAMRTRTSAVN